MNRPDLKLTLSFCLFFAVLANLNAQQTFVFVGQDGALWSKTTSWDLGSVPNSSDATAIVERFGNGFDTKGEAVYDLANGTLEALIVGNNRNGRFLMKPGTALNVELSMLGRSQAASGFASAEGAGTVWDHSWFLNVGNFGYGELDVLSGAVVSTETFNVGAGVDAEGLTTVSGADSKLIAREQFNVSDRGRGRLIVNNGGSIEAAISSIGRDVDGNGIASIHGANSSWSSTDRFRIGDGGNGQLSISGGATVSNTLGQIGFGAGTIGRASIEDSGSQWIHSRQLQIGYFGDGKLDITQGAQVESNGTIVGISAGSSGELNLSGNNTLLDTTFIYSGYNNAGGPAEINVLDGAKIVALNDSNATTGVMMAGVFGGSTGDINIHNATADVIATYIGVSGHGNLDLSENASLTSQTDAIAVFANSSGTATLSNGSEWRSASSLVVGGLLESDGGLGQLNLSGSSMFVGDVSKQEYTNSSALFGASSRLLVGDNDNVDNEGILVIRNGSTIDNSAPQAVTYVGLIEDTVGKIRVMGDETEFNNWTIRVGGDGTGTLEILNGADVSSRFGFVGSRSLGSGRTEISGDGSTWEIVSELRVGNAGNGMLKISDQGYLQDGFARVGVGGGAGQVDVSGAGSQWRHISNLYLGHTGSAIMNIRDGGYVKNATGIVGNTPNGEGVATITGAGSQWENRESLFVGGDETGSQGSGTVCVQDGGELLVENDLVVWSTGQLKIGGGSVITQTLALEPGNNFEMTSGYLSADTVRADFFQVAGGKVDVDEFISYSDREPLTVVQTGGTLAPGQSPGSTIINGNYILDGGAIEIELAGLTPETEHDTISITGDFTILSGSLDVSLLNNFALSNGDEFLVANVEGTQSGNFDGVEQDQIVGRFRDQFLFIDYFAGDGNDIRLYSATVPEPGCLLLLGLIPAVCCLRRKRRSD